MRPPTARASRTVPVGYMGRPWKAKISAPLAVRAVVMPFQSRVFPARVPADASSVASGTPAVVTGA